MNSFCSTLSPGVSPDTVLTIKSPNKACANAFPGCSRDVSRRRDLQLLVWFKLIGLSAAILPRSYGFSRLPKCIMQLVIKYPIQIAKRLSVNKLEYCSEHFEPCP